MATGIRPTERADLARRESPRAGTAAPPRWSQVPEPPAPSVRSGRVGVRSAVGLAAALVLWELGRPLAATALAVMVAAVTVAALVSPAIAAGADRVTRWVARAAGLVVSFLVLGAVQLLVITPVAFVMRLVGHDPLARGSSPTDATFWRPSAPRERAQRLYKRGFAYERSASARTAKTRRGTAIVRLQSAVGLVVVLMLVDVGVGAAARGVVHLARGSASHDTLKDVPWPEVAAGRNEPWGQALANEVNYVVENRRYDPNVMWKVPDFSGRYVHTRRGVRRSYVPTGATSPGAVDVFFFGGSATFGWYQRDEHTIPSEFARLAEADGIPVRVVNYGTPAYVNWQEVLLFQQLLSGGARPDLAVFYDGGNDVAAQFRGAPTREPTNMFATELRQRFDSDPKDKKTPLLSRVLESYSDNSAIVRVLRWASLLSKEKSGRRIVPIWASDQSSLRLARRRGQAAAAVQAHGVDTAQRLAASYGAQAAFFWQPTIYTKRSRTDESNVPGLWAEDHDAWGLASRVARSDVRAPVVDLSDALDGLHEPVMYDFVHTNEEGAKAVARAMYLRLRPALLAAWQGGSR